MSKDESLMDLRILKRNRRKGLVTPEALEDHVKRLKDASDNAVPFRYERSSDPATRERKSTE
jgi:hypothetical protein